MVEFILITVVVLSVFLGFMGRRQGGVRQRHHQSSGDSRPLGGQFKRIDSETHENDEPSFERFSFPPNRPPGKWVQWPIGSGWFEIAGTQYRIEGTQSFLRAAAASADNRKPFGIVLRAEPGNKFDRNALRVVGWAADSTGQRTEEHLGYVPATLAEQVANWPADMPIAAELKRASIGDVRVFITVAGLVPPKKERDKNGWRI